MDSVTHEPAAVASRHAHEMDSVTHEPAAVASRHAHETDSVTHEPAAVASAMLMRRTLLLTSQLLLLPEQGYIATCDID